jgi:hypothetical protein
LGSDFTLCIDDDNGFETNLIELLNYRYQELSHQLKSELILTPTVFYHKSNVIQQQ